MDISGVQYFDIGDKISIYAWTGSNEMTPPTEKRAVNNVINTYGDDYEWHSSVPMLWKNPYEKHYFIGIYPSLDTTLDDFTQIPYKLDTSKQIESDMLVSLPSNGIEPTSTPVKLKFRHVMSAIDIRLRFRNEWDNEPTVEKVVLKNALSEATVKVTNCFISYTIAEGTITPQGDAVGKITTMPPATIDGYFEANVISNALRATSSPAAVELTINGKTSIIRLSTPISLEAGKYYTITINVS